MHANGVPENFFNFRSKDKKCNAQYFAKCFNVSVFPFRPSDGERSANQYKTIPRELSNTLFRSSCVNISRRSIVICNQLWLLSCDDGFQRECHSMSQIVMRKRASWNSPFRFNVWQRSGKNRTKPQVTLNRYYYSNHAFWCIFGDQK